MRPCTRWIASAEDLNRLRGLAAGDARGEQLGLGALDGVGPAGLLEPRGPPGQRAGGLDLGLHVGELLLDLAEAADRPAERAPLAAPATPASDTPARVPR